MTLVAALVLIKVPLVAKAFGAVNDAVFYHCCGFARRHLLRVRLSRRRRAAVRSQGTGADFILAFQALPIVLVMSVLTTLLFYWRVLPPIVRGMAWLLERTLGVGGAVGLSTAANIFLGMVEAPLFIRPYLSQLTRSELFLVMTGGMAGIAGTVLVLYATLLAPLIPDAGRAFRDHLRARGTGRDPGQPDHGAGDFRQAHRRPRWKIPTYRRPRTMDAIVKGTAAGLELLLNIVAMLLVLVALVYLANAILGLLPSIGGAKIPSTASWLSDGAGMLADRPAIVAGRHGGKLDGDQDGPERTDRLCRSVKARR